MTQIINASGNVGYLKANVTPVVLVDSNGNIINLSGVGTGNVMGPGSSTNNAVTVWNGTTGASIKDSSFLINGTTLSGVTYNFTNLIGLTNQSIIQGNFLDIKSSANFPNTSLTLHNDQVGLNSDGLVNIFASAGYLDLSNTSGALVDIAQNGQIGIASAPNQKIIFDAGSGNIQLNSSLSVLNSGILNLGSQSATFKVAYIDILSGNAVNQTARAWAHFSGVGGITVGDSYGVGSILRNTTGDYTVNWSTPFKSDRYCVTVSAGGGIATNFDASVAVQSGSSCRITTNNLLSLTDAGNINVQAFGTI